jgi:ABC-type transporter Mla subunit MlaD
LEEIAATYGLTIPQIKEATTTLQEAFDSLSNDDMALNQYLLDLTDAAEELNISFDELLKTVTNINTMFSVTADEALDLSKTIHKTA